jgi:hypothetical protein
VSHFDAPLFIESDAPPIIYSALLRRREVFVCRTMNVMVNVSYLRNSSGRVKVIGFSQLEALRPVK